MLESDFEGLGFGLGFVWIRVVGTGEVALLKLAIVAIIFDEGFLIVGSHVDWVIEFGDFGEGFASWVAPRSGA